MSAPPAVNMSAHGEIPPSTETEIATRKVEQKHDNSLICSTPLDVLLPCNTCFILPERQNMVQLFFGNYHGTITQPGCYCRTAIGMELRRVATDLITIDMSNTKVLDVRGSPVIVSGIVTYQIVDARKAAIDVSDPHRYVRDQSPAILKRVVSQFPYESVTESEPSLRTETSVVAERMREALQQKCAVAGVYIHSFSINELSYAPEVAQAMLKRQQAEALIQARQQIVKGARDIAREAVDDIGTNMSDSQKATLLSNLLVVLVGDKDVTPTVQL